MRKLFTLTVSIIAVVAILLSSSISSAQTDTPTGSSDPSKLGVFEAVTPCSNVTPAIPQIPADAQCEMMIWHLTLYQNPATHTPTTYILHNAYGMSQPRSGGIAGGGINIDLEGKWTILHSTPSKQDAVVYQLNPDSPSQAIYLIKMDDNLLHVLNKDMRLMVGTTAWSYTLNRTDTRPTSNASALLGEATPQPTLLPTPSDGSSIVGDFGGRTPCNDIVVEFTKAHESGICQRIKWGLQLYQDAATGMPTTYKFGPRRQTFREGTWMQTRGTKADPNGIVYRLKLLDSGHTIMFLKADENHLFLLDSDLNLMVGNTLLSYTLSRTN